MKGINMMGLIFANKHDSLVKDLTDMRAMGSVPFGGRYRLIDFSLSNMVNADVSKVGVLTNANYHSLMDHMGTGKAFDLARKQGGLYILPPNLYRSGSVNATSLEQLISVRNFISNSVQEYVYLCDADVVSNFNLKKMLRKHVSSGADITVGYRYGKPPKGNCVMDLKMDAEGAINEILISPSGKTECNYGLGMYIIRRELLLELIDEASAHSRVTLTRDLFQRNVDKCKMYGYEIEGYVAVIDSAETYLKANMDLLKSENRQALLRRDYPVLTKVRDEAPVKYGLNSAVKNSLIADGSVIEGTVENSVIFRNVKIGKGAVVKNCVLMQGTQIGDNARLEYVCADKNVTIGEGRELKGSETYQVFIKKAAKV